MKYIIPKKKIVGYVVIGPSGVYKAAPNERGDKDTLWLGGGVTLFPTTAVAKRTLRRTQKIAQQLGYEWSWLDHSYVIPVRAL